MSNYMDTYRQWCTDPYFDEDTKAELKKIEGDQAEIEDRFYRQLEFGTGGLRGVIGAGTNRMNFILCVRQHRDLQIISSPRTDRRKVLRSHMIQESCPQNLQRKQRFA